MPFRRAHWFILALAPLIVLAFWRGYFGMLGSAPIEFHLHGISASLWLALLAFQSYSIANGKRALHRTTGLASFVFFPVFLASALIVFIPEARGFVAKDGPFYSIYPPMLAWADILSTGGMAVFYHRALAHRRNPALHGGYMLATALFLLPPILGRLFNRLLDSEVTQLGVGFHGAFLATAATGAIIALRTRGKGRRPFAIAAAVGAASSLVYVWPGKTDWWARSFAHLADVSWSTAAVSMVALGALIGWHGWNAGRRPARTGRAIPLPV